MYEYIVFCVFILDLSLSLFLSVHIGGIITGGLSDLIGARAISCVIMMYLAVPTVSC